MTTQTKANGKKPDQRNGIDPVALTVEQAAAACSISRSLMYELIRDCRIESVSIGRRRLVPVCALHRLIDVLLEAEVDARRGN